MASDLIEEEKEFSPEEKQKLLQRLAASETSLESSKLLDWINGLPAEPWTEEEWLSEIVKQAPLVREIVASWLPAGNEREDVLCQAIKLVERSRQEYRYDSLRAFVVGVAWKAFINSTEWKQRETSDAAEVRTSSPDGAAAIQALLLASAGILIQRGFSDAEVVQALGIPKARAAELLNNAREHLRSSSGVANSASGPVSPPDSEIEPRCTEEGRSTEALPRPARASTDSATGAREQSMASRSRDDEAASARSPSIRLAQPRPNEVSPPASDVRAVRASSSTTSAVRGTHWVLPAAAGLLLGIAVRDLLLSEELIVPATKPSESRFPPSPSEPVVRTTAPDTPTDVILKGTESISTIVDFYCGGTVRTPGENCLLKQRLTVEIKSSRGFSASALVCDDQGIRCSDVRRTPSKPKGGSAGYYVLDLLISENADVGSFNADLFVSFRDAGGATRTSDGNVSGTEEQPPQSLSPQAHSFQWKVKK